jgi:predicted aspartyl protease
MGTSKRQLIPRRHVAMMGEVRVRVTVENAADPSRRIEAVGLVDTGATGLILPAAWKDRLEPLSHVALVDLETVDQRTVTAEVRGPVAIQLDGFRRMLDEVTFVDMQPGPDGGYEPLVGYTVLEKCKVVVDLVTHRLVERRHYLLKRAAA